MTCRISQTQFVHRRLHVLLHSLLACASSDFQSTHVWWITEFYIQNSMDGSMMRNWCEIASLHACRLVDTERGWECMAMNVFFLLPRQSSGILFWFAFSFTKIRFTIEPVTIDIRSAHRALRFMHPPRLFHFRHFRPTNDLRKFQRNRSRQRGAQTASKLHSYTAWRRVLNELSNIQRMFED